MDTAVLLGSAAVGVAVPLLVWGAAMGSARSSDRARQNLGSAVPLTDEREVVLQQSAVDRAVLPTIRALSARARRLTPAGWVDSLQRQLRLAGSPRAWPLDRLLAAKMILGLVGVLTALLVIGSGLTGPKVLLSVVLGVGLFFVPDLILWGRAQERQTAIAFALPDTLDQMTISVEAGLGFDAALKRSARAGRGPLADEFEYVLGELRLGVGRNKAFRNLADRSSVPELRQFAFAVQQADEYGLPVAQVLRVQAAELRVKRRQRAEERAMKIPVKIVFPLVTCIFPTLFAVLLGPAVIRIARVLF
jgi:tight adherence protein C